MLITLLLSVFRMIVLPVEFSDRELGTTREEQAAMVSEAEAYFNRQYGEAEAFRIELGPAVTLSHPLNYYGANSVERRDVRLPDAVREACNLAKGEVDFSAYDGDGDGTVDCVILLTAGPGEQAGGDEADIWPQQGCLSKGSSVLTIKGKRIDPYIAAPEGELGLLCHEIGHILALPDFYDTDGDDSGGRTPGLWQTSVMDDGCVLPAPPDFGAPEFDVLGLGECEPLAPGHYELAPLPEGRRYLKAPTDRKDEYFLFAVGPDGLLVYHIDRSDAPAGFCTRHGKDLTAAERWEFGAINDNPAHPCARLLPANPTAVDADATQTDALAFPQPGFESFGSDTPSAFRAWSGRASGLALTGIRRGEDGSVSFDVIEPIVLTGLTVYQDAALVSWTTDPALEGVQGFTVSWTDGTEEGAGSIDLDAGAVSCTLEGLKPQTAYSFSVQVRLSERDRFSVGGGFLTKVYRGGTYPYIYLNGAARNIDGSFPPGSKIPLRVFNATDVQEVRWTLDGTRISPAADGYYTIHRSGTLRATILHSDGSTETILKEITVQ